MANTLVLLQNLLFIYSCFDILVLSQQRFIDFVTNKCEKIDVPLCGQIGYFNTFMPNKFNMDTQYEAALELHKYWPLVHMNCSQDLRFFLCSMYLPICLEQYPLYIPSCRSVCERAKSGCESILEERGFHWPEQWKCSKFPLYENTHRICMDPLKTKKLV